MRYALTFLALAALTATPLLHSTRIVRRITTRTNHVGENRLTLLDDTDLVFVDAATMNPAT